MSSENLKTNKSQRSMLEKYSPVLSLSSVRKKNDIKDLSN